MLLIKTLTMFRILASVPLAAFLVLFDLVVDNPTHPETAANLALLDVGGGHFSGLEYASQGTLPGSIASEFTQIARTYVREQGDLEISSCMNSSTVTPDTWLSEPAISGTSSAFVSSTDLQSYPLGWNLRDDDGSVFGTDMLDLFGSYYPLWDEGGTYNPMNV
jgi:hypothetical protein